MGNNALWARFKGLWAVDLRTFVCVCVCARVDFYKTCLGVQALISVVVVRMYVLKKLLWGPGTKFGAGPLQYNHKYIMTKMAPMDFFFRVMKMVTPFLGGM